MEKKVGRSKSKGKTVKCTCKSQLSIAKDALKQVFKTKYEARLSALKSELESKFKKNDLTWKSRLDCHRQALMREQAKNREYEEMIREMSERMAELERKNTEMRQMVVR